MRRIIAVLSLLLGIGVCLQGQEVIKLNNPSFEDKPRAGDFRGIEGWIDCNEPGQSFVDVQPGFFEVNLPASDGGSYAGMVVRSGGSVEGLSQLLRKPLLKNQDYVLSVDLAKSNLYISSSRDSRKEENFANPVVLKIYGCVSYCNNDQLLTTVGPIDHEEWKKYFIKFRPDKEYEFFAIEVGYVSPHEPYNGNLLIDNLSTIYAVDEDTDPEAFFNN